MQAVSFPGLDYLGCVGIKTFNTYLDFFGVRDTLFSMLDPEHIRQIATAYAAGITAIASAVALAWKCLKPIVADFVKTIKGGASKKIVARAGEKKSYSWIPVHRTAFNT